ncbi:MAG: alanine racemase [Candidatus Komeilibacteria bacterium]
MNTSWLEISRSNLHHNVDYFRQLLRPPTKLFAVVKGNAYGHGQKEIVSLLKNNQAVDGFAVFELAESLALRRQTNKPIMVLGYYSDETDDLRRAARANIILLVVSLATAQRLNRLGVKVKVQIKVDVGTNRLGINYRQAFTEIKKIYQLKNLAVQGIFSHFADSENHQQTFTHQQFQRFSQICRQLQKNRITSPFNHIACTAAVLRDPAYQVQGMRLGIGLYGLSPFITGQNRGVLKPILSWKTRVLQIKPVKPGDTVGYAQSYRVKSNGYIATLPVGYYDGYDRRLSNNAEVLIAGRRYPVVGRICMNVIMVALPQKHHIKPRQLVTLIGRDGSETVTADELAARSHTINYEIVSRISPLLPRIICS